MKKFYVYGGLLTVLLMVGCSDTAEDRAMKAAKAAMINELTIKSLQSQPGFAGCVYGTFEQFRSLDGNSNTIKMVRCPNSTTTTTYQEYKTETSVVVQDVSK